MVRTTMPVTTIAAATLLWVTRASEALTASTLGTLAAFTTSSWTTPELQMPSVSPRLVAPLFSHTRMLKA